MNQFANVLGKFTGDPLRVLIVDGGHVTSVKNYNVLGDLNDVNLPDLKRWQKFAELSALLEFCPLAIYAELFASPLDVRVANTFAVTLATNCSDCAIGWLVLNTANSSNRIWAAPCDTIFTSVAVYDLTFFGSKLFHLMYFLSKRGAETPNTSIIVFSGSESNLFIKLK